MNPEAEYQYSLGLDDELKFHINQKPETQQLAESMGLDWARDPYILELTDEEKKLSAERRKQINPQKTKVIGYNTGCSLLYPNKKFTVEFSIELIKKLEARVSRLYGSFVWWPRRRRTPSGHESCLC